MNLLLPKLNFFAVIILLFSCGIFAQSTGDYRSAGTGNWITLSSWQYYNGTSWVTPSGTSPQGYPGQFVGTGSVLIQTGHTITLSATITTMSFGTLTITGRLTLTGDNGAVEMDFNLTTQSIVVTPSSGFIEFNDKLNLKLPTNASLQVPTGGLDVSAPCTANQVIYIGVSPYSKCNGGGSLPDFTELMAGGGTLNTIPTSNSPVCINSTINLFGSYSGVVGTTTSNGATTGVNYSWSIQPPSGSAIVSNLKDYSFTATLSGTYTATLTCTSYYGTALFTNSKTISVIVSPTSVGGSVSGGISICSGTNSTTLTLSGHTGNIVRWESSLNNFTTAGTSITNTTTTLTAINLSSTTSYRAVVQSGTCTSINSASTTITVITTAIPTIGTITQPNCVLATGSVVLSGLPASGTWTLTRSGTSSATTTGTGTSATILGLAAGTYNYTVFNGTCTSGLSANVLITASSTKTWNGSSWSPSTPTANDTANFASGIYNSTGDLAICSCQVSGATVTFLSGHTLTVTNAVTVASGSLFFNDTASLVQINNVDANSGNISYNRDIYSRNTDYIYWSSPVLGQTIGSFSPNTLAGKYYSFDSSIENWKQEATTTIMTAGKGYIIRGQEAQSGSPAPPPAPYIFVGKPNNGSYEITSVLADKSYLIGNPYPSALDANTFLLQNKDILYGTIYFWTHNTQIGTSTSNLGTGALAYTQDDYASYNFTGGVGVGVTIDPANPTASTIPTGKIAAGQGFFATSKPSIIGSKIVFNNNMRVGVDGITGANTQFFKMSNTKGKTTDVNEKNRVWLNLTNTQGAFKQTLIGYITGATNAIDNAFDGESFDGQEFVDFYSVNQDKNLTIQGRALPFDESDSVPLGFRSTIEGIFTINIAQVDGSMMNQSVFIEDKLMNTIFDLKSGNYTFNTVKGTFNERFVLRYTNPNAKTLGVNTVIGKGNKVLVSNKNKLVKINSFSETIDKVFVYDLLGRQIYQKASVNSNELSISNLVSSRQTLLVKTVLQNGETVSTKIIY